MSYPEQVKAFLWSDISRMSETPELFSANPEVDFTRIRKLSFEGLVRFLISMQSGTTSHELVKFFNFDPSVISNSGFYQQRQKLLVEAFSFLLRQFNSHFPFELYKERYNLVGCDGSEFNIARNPDDPDTFHVPNGKSQRGFNMLHTISLYDLLSKRYLDCVVQPGMKKNEFRAICDLVDNYSYDGHPIFIADRGFASYNFFAHAAEKDVLFMVRAKDVNVRRITKLDSLPDLLDTHVDILLSRSQSKKNRKFPYLAEQYRYICPDVAFDYIKPGSLDEYPISIRIVRFKVMDGVFENIITNLPTDEFPPDEIKFLYHLRWGIETSFRDLKHTIGAVNFHSKQTKYIEQEIWARIILFNFCTIISLHVIISKNNTRYTYQLNLSMAIKICHHFISLREFEPPPNLEALIGRFVLPIRLERNFARQHRFQLPASFCYRFS